jgi:RNA polymerase sigma-70 factor (ECF subfamily)
MTRHDSLPAKRHPAPGVSWPAVLAGHERWLRTIVFARLGEPQAVDEVMQEIALAAVKQQAPLSNPAKVAPWLYRVAVRQTLLYRRKQGRLRKLNHRLVERAVSQPSDGPIDDPLDWLLAEERRRLVRRALEKLAPTDAQLLLLKYSENWSYAQIAERLGVSESAIESRLHRARQRMRQELTALNVIEVPA